MKTSQSILKVPIYAVLLGLLLIVPILPSYIASTGLVNEAIHNKLTFVDQTLLDPWRWVGSLLVLALVLGGTHIRTMPPLKWAIFFCIAMIAYSTPILISAGNWTGYPLNEALNWIMVFVVSDIATLHGPLAGLLSIGALGILRRLKSPQTKPGHTSTDSGFSHSARYR